MPPDELENLANMGRLKRERLDYQQKFEEELAFQHVFDSYYGDGKSVYVRVA